MSLDRSLKSKASLSRHRNVLSRDERIQLLTEQEKFKDGSSPFGLQKVGHRKAAVVGKTKKETPKEGEAAVAGAPAAGAAPAATTGKAGPAAKAGPAGKAAPGAKAAPAGKGAGSKPAKK